MKQYSYFIIFFKFNHSLVPKKDTYIQNFRKFYRFSHNVKLLDALKRIFLAKSELNKSFVMKKKLARYSFLKFRILASLLCLPNAWFDYYLANSGAQDLRVDLE